MFLVQLYHTKGAFPMRLLALMLPFLYIGTMQSEHISFWNFDIGNLCIILGLILQALILLMSSSRKHGENQETIKQLITWKNLHMSDAEERDKAIAKLERISSTLTETCKSIHDSMSVIRQDLRDIRHAQENRRKDFRG